MTFRHTWVVALLCLFMSGCATQIRHLRSDVNAAVLAGNIEQAWNVVGDSHGWVIPIMEGIITDSGYTLIYGEKIEGPNGEVYFAATVKGKHLMAVRSGLSPNMQVSTLIHEYAHTLAPLSMASSEEETWAEGIAFLTCRALGLDTRRETVHYLAQVPPLQRGGVFAVYGKEMEGVASRLAARVEKAK